MRRSALHWRLCIALLLLCAISTCLLSVFFGIPPSSQHERFVQMMHRMSAMATSPTGTMMAGSDNALATTVDAVRAAVHKPLARTPEQLLRDIGIVASPSSPAAAAAAATFSDKDKSVPLKQQQQQKTIVNDDNVEPVSLPLPTVHDLASGERRHRERRGCLQTAESPLYITDDLGRTCLRQHALDTGCCDTQNTTRVAFLSCYTCSIDRQVRTDMKEVISTAANNDDSEASIYRRCCQHFELCVSCCMRHSTDASQYSSHEQMADAYKRCKAWCRTNGDSIFDEEHQHFVHGYVDPQHRYCFLHVHGDPTAHLSVVNHHLASSMLRRQTLDIQEDASMTKTQQQRQKQKQPFGRRDVYRRVLVEREIAPMTTNDSSTQAVPPPSQEKPSPTQRMDFKRL